ncbi:ABC transporter permease [Celerinatantimonas sp. MCCC 1A17872]|uniref:ABC transporter permease n=1 Tax=Celerinatantimonas sp. MCCC 1A17872 TaxID=3177514 RepID=UPI0038C224D1
MKRTNWRPLLVLLPFIVLIGLFQLAPLVWVIINSLFNDSGSLSLSNYQQVLTSPFYLQAFEHSLIIALSSSVIGLILATIGCASLRHTSKRVRNGLLAFANMTSNFVGVPLAFAFVIILGFNGMITLILRHIGWLGGFNLYNTSGLTVIYSYFQIPLAMLLLYPAFDALKKDWQEAAFLLGADNKYYWRRIALPVLTPALLGTFIILIANGLGTYATVYALTSGNYNIVTVRIASLVSGDIFLEPNLAAAISVLLMVILVVITVINQKVIQRSYHVS